MFYQYCQVRGWLCKRGVKGLTGHRWRRRWFSTDTDGRLYYYKKNNNTMPQGYDIFMTWNIGLITGCGVGCGGVRVVAVLATVISPYLSCHKWKLSMSTSSEGAVRGITEQSSFSYKRNLKVWPLKWKLLLSTFLWCCLCYYWGEFIFLHFLNIIWAEKYVSKGFMVFLISFKVHWIRKNHSSAR